MDSISPAPLSRCTSIEPARSFLLILTLSQTMDALRCRFNRRKQSKQRTEMKSIRLPSSKRKLSPSVISVISCLSLIQRFTHRGDESFVVERFHEKCDRTNGHGGGV